MRNNTLPLGIARRFQDSIEGQRLAIDGRYKRVMAGKKLYETLKELYVEMPDWRMIEYAEVSGLIKRHERNDIHEYLGSNLRKWELERK